MCGARRHLLRNLNRFQLPRSFLLTGTDWHLIQEGHEEDERIPDLRRCERLPWIPWVISNAASHPEIDRWQNMQKREINSLLWYREECLVVLSQRKNYWLLKPHT